MAAWDKTFCPKQPEPTLAQASFTQDPMPDLVRREMLAQKIDAVAESLACAGGKVYCETSHMFLWWADALMASKLAEEHRIDVVVLRRYLPAMLRYEDDGFVNPTNPKCTQTLEPATYQCTHANPGPASALGT